MRRHIVLPALAFMICLMSWIHFATTQAQQDGVQAYVNIDPDSLLLKEDDYGKWITAYIELPAGYEVNDINVSSVTLHVLGGTVSVSKSDVQGNVLMAKFDRGLVIGLLWPLTAHMSPRVKLEVTLKVTGNLNDNTAFSGSDTINVFFTHL